MVESEQQQQQQQQKEIDTKRKRRRSERGNNVRTTPSSLTNSRCCRSPRNNHQYTDDVEKTNKTKLNKEREKIVAWLLLSFVVALFKNEKKCKI